VRELNRLAVEGLEPTAGKYRTEDVVIAGSKHVPPPWQDVPRLVDEMCTYVSERASLKEDVTLGIHLAAYVMWRLNWIHPFANGNGRTARAASYLVECIQLRALLPGEVTIPHRIARNRFPYNDALEAADSASKEGRLDVGEMEKVLVRLTLEQLKGDP
jgi:Fic family protein